MKTAMGLSACLLAASWNLLHDYDDLPILAILNRVIWMTVVFMVDYHTQAQNERWRRSG